jgi:hypothetical protein
MDRASELAAIAAFVAQGSITRCPAGLLPAPSAAPCLVSKSSPALERLQLQPPLSHWQIKDLLFVALKARSRPSR